MLQRVLSSELQAHINQIVRVRGWINNSRKLGKLHFLILRDRAGFSQIVIDNPDEFCKISSLQPGSILTVTGKVVSSSLVSFGIEIINPSIRPLSKPLI